MNPSSYRPTSFEGLIGPAARLGLEIHAKLQRLNPRTDTLRYMLCGEPGVGKSLLCSIIALILAGDARNVPFCVEKISGPKLNAETVTAWHNNRGIGTLYGDWTVKIIEEADKIPHIAQVQMLDYLDSLTPGTAILCTSNKDSAEITERFHTRFQFREVAAPTQEEIAAFLRRQWPGLRPVEVNMIAMGAGGNVRAALLDAETALDKAACALAA